MVMLKKRRAILNMVSSSPLGIMEAMELYLFSEMQVADFAAAVACHRAHAQKLSTHLEKYNMWLSRMEALLERT